MLFERVGDILILVHGAEAPSDAEWQSYVSAAHLGLHNDPPLTGFLVTTPGGAPSSGQRKVMLDTASAKPIPTCVCTDSRLVRGVVTAVSRVYPARMHALRLQDVERALKLLGVPEALQAEAVKAVTRLQNELSVRV
jgi:hypothetical protein